MRILYVEDDESSQRLLVKGLAAKGIEVIIAVDGISAIDLLRREAFDALILDVMMPGIDGLQVGKVARKEGKRKDVPIILLTAHPYALRESGAKWLKPVASLTKPARLEKITEILKKCFAEQPADLS